MAKTTCLFCNIADGKIPAYKIYEDKKHVAFLDIFPNVEGQALLIPKRHTVSLFSDVNDKNIAEFIVTSKKVANLIRNRLKVGRVHLVLEGTGVNHLHAKLYPTSGLNSKAFKEIIASERVYFKKYPGYVTTILGPRASASALERVQKKFRH